MFNATTDAATTDGGQHSPADTLERRGSGGMSDTDLQHGLVAGRRHDLVLFARISLSAFAPHRSLDGHRIELRKVSSMSLPLFSVFSSQIDIHREDRVRRKLQRDSAEMNTDESCRFSVFRSSRNGMMRATFIPQ